MIGEIVIIGFMKIEQLKPFIEDLRESETREKYITALTCAVESMEKQMPKIITRSDMSKPYLCPTCNSRRFWKDGEYCTSCGQKLIWEN